MAAWASPAVAAAAAGGVGPGVSHELGDQDEVVAVADEQLGRRSRLTDADTAARLAQLTMNSRAQARSAPDGTVTAARRRSTYSR